MKITLCSEISAELPNVKILLDSLKRLPEVTEVTKINPHKMAIECSTGRERYFFDNVEFVPNNYDVAIVRGGFGHVSSTVEFIKYCRKNGVKVFDNNFSTEKYLINKKADIIRLSRAGMNIPNSYFFIDEEDLINSNLQYPLIAKTINTGKGKNIEIVNSIDDVINFIKKVEKKVAEIMLQEIIDYEHDLRVFVTGEKVVGCMKRTPKEGDFRANFSLGGKVEPFAASKEIEQTAIQAAKATNLEVSGVDILVGKDGKLWALETNRTPGVEGISKVFGESLGDQIVRYMVEKAY